MFTRAPIVVVLGLAIAPAGCLRVEQLASTESNPTEEFTSTDYKFKVKFPGKPKQTERTELGIKVKMFSVEERDGAYMVGVSDMPIPERESERQIQNRLDGARDGAIRNVNGKLKSSSPITLNGKYPGREFTATITKPIQGQTRARIYLVNRRLYQVMLVGTDSYATSPQATEFLNSFQLVE
jgi:hypothetical protein